MSGKKRPAIVIRDLSTRAWMAGGVVTRTMALSLKCAGANVSYATSSADFVPSGIEGIILPEPSYIPLEWTARRCLHMGAKETLLRCLKDSDVVLPIVEPAQAGRLPSVGWIPDFQHLHLPELFTGSQRNELDNRFRKLAKRSTLLCFSSEAVAGDFRMVFPKYAHKARIASFPSLFAFEPPVADPFEVLSDYPIPQKFLLVINQFWRHKNHSTVAKALGLLKKNGLGIPTIMVGMPADYRDRENSALSDTLQALAKGGSWPDCLVLGKIPRTEIEALLRRATLLVQPSKFEGWNTTVQDAKALGCPVIVSDLQVHREQCPEAVGFFHPDEPEALANLLAEQWDSLPTRPDPASEKISLMREIEFARTYGETLLAICSECVR